MPKMRLAFIQPLLPTYRSHVLDALCDAYDVTLLAKFGVSVESGFRSGVGANVECVDAPTRDFVGGRLSYQTGVNLFLIRNRPDIVLTCANPRLVSYWLTLLLCRFLGIVCYSHGQGVYRYANPGLSKRIMYRCMVWLSTKYICYTELSRNSLAKLGCSLDKLKVADNSVLLGSTIPPSMKSGSESGVLFVGRLRKGCRLDLLIEAIQALKDQGREIVLHVVGGGELEGFYKENFSFCKWIVWHGAVHDDAQIAHLSRFCRIGCYPGDAGLSVVHMFGLSLPPVVHGSLSEHMGPEPSYIVDEVNGYFFDKRSDTSLYEILKKVWDSPCEKLSSVSKAAYENYVSLNTPPLGDRFVSILRGDR